MSDQPVRLSQNSLHHFTTKHTLNPPLLQLSWAGHLASGLCDVPRATFCKHTTGLIVTKEARGVEGDNSKRGGKRVRRKEGTPPPPLWPPAGLPFLC
jgi:hypothetical protein